MKKPPSPFTWAAGAGLALALALPPAMAATPALKLEPCRLRGVEHDALCGVLQRPLNPAQPQGPSIGVHVAVLPALARNKKPDPVFLLAGGPGQSAIGLAATAEGLFARLLNRRDVVLVDQRGVGRSAPLACEDDEPTAPLAGRLDNDGIARLVARCREALQKLPHGDLRQYTTTIAMQDIDAVRAALGAERVNVIGGSYGTRAGLEYARQFPQRVRRMVLDGVAPPDMALPATFSPDGQAALDAVFAACEADAGCQGRHPQLRERWRAFGATLPRAMAVTHPLTGAAETLTVTRDLLAAQVRMPLYAPALAAALPAALERVLRSDLGPLLALSLGMSTRRESQLAMGMHFSVVCAEDLPRMAQAQERPGADFGTQFAELYTRACADWPRGEVPPAFYTVPALAAPTLLLSGGADPVTPPRHGDRVARALGPAARHVVVAQAGHGVMALPCMRDALFRFVDADTDAAAQQVDAHCARAVPRPPAFVPLAPVAPQPGAPR
ncbi:MAG: alpha/beta fold hydrolase [Rubrivivax sp.]